MLDLFELLCGTSATIIMNQSLVKICCSAKDLTFDIQIFKILETTFHLIQLSPEESLAM